MGPRQGHGLTVGQDIPRKGGVVESGLHFSKIVTVTVPRRDQERPNSGRESGGEAVKTRPGCAEKQDHTESSNRKAGRTWDSLDGGEGSRKSVTSPSPRFPVWATGWR